LQERDTDLDTFNISFTICFHLSFIVTIKLQIVSLFL